MKKLLKLRRFSFVRFSIVLFSVIAVFSCKDSSNPITEIRSEALIDKNKIGNPFEYAKENLTLMGKGVLLSSQKNADFKRLIYQEVEKRFDGDFNVLIKKLETMGEKMNVNLRTDIQIAAGKPNARISGEDILKAFSDIDGKDYNPQVFIPFYENLKKKGVIGKTQPVIVPFNGDGRVNEFEGFVMDEKRNISRLPYLIDEKYAREHEVWVISINERTNGDILPVETSTYSNKRTSVSGSGRITNINVKTHKEGWAAGANEVHMAGAITTISGTSGGIPYASVFRWPSDAPKIADWPQNDLNIPWACNWWIQTINSSREWIVLAPNKGSHLYYVIFEHDSWPNALVDHVFTAEQGNQQIFVPYRSSESAYIGDYAVSTTGSTKSIGSNYNVSNNDISLSIGFQQ